MRLSDRDLGFLIETFSPEVTDKQMLKRIIEEDEDFRKNYRSDLRFPEREGCGLFSPGGIIFW